MHPGASPLWWTVKEHRCERLKKRGTYKVTGMRKYPVYVDLASRLQRIATR